MGVVERARLAELCVGSNPSRLLAMVLCVNGKHGVATELRLLTLPVHPRSRGD